MKLRFNLFFLIININISPFSKENKAANINKSVEVDSKLDENVKPSTGVNNTKVLLTLSLTSIRFKHRRYPNP